MTYNAVSQNGTHCIQEFLSNTVLGRRESVAPTKVIREIIAACGVVVYAQPKLANKYFIVPALKPLYQVCQILAIHLRTDVPATLVMSTLFYLSLHRVELLPTKRTPWLF